MSSSSSSIILYDVFLSFRGSDTRRSFISHLNHTLVKKGLRVRRITDDETLPVGESPLAAIRASKTAVVVISKNYASSSWCLEELAEILEFRRQGSLKVFPVFYGVDPIHVNKQTGEFDEQFWKHLSKNPEKIQRWREALVELGNIPGEASNNWEDDANLVHKITDDLYNCLNNLSFNLYQEEKKNDSSFNGFNGLVMDTHMELIFDLLDLESEIDEVRVIGIYGEKGVGKTTIAKYLYQVISPYFDVHVQVEDVNKILQNPQSQRVEPSAMIPRDGIASLTGQRVLLLVDGVDTVEKINIIRKDIKLFGSGSRVIFTSRSKSLLLACDIKHLYQVEPIGFSKALQSYDVYLCYRWSDTGTGFISHLRHSLAEKGILMNHHKDILFPQEGGIHQAIQASRIAVVVMSKNYASSSWNLEELVDILEFRRKGSLSIFPVYYKIDPSHVRKQTGKFGKQFLKHLKRKPDKTQRWTEALVEFGRIPGHRTNNWESEQKLIQDITEDICYELNANISSRLVGMHLHMEQLYELLNLNSKHKESCEIGICGSTGIGKTTVARYLYQQISPYFHTRLILDNVGKICQDNGSSRLQEELIWIHIQSSSRKGSNVTKQSLQNQKVLLTVDGVDDYEQIKCIQKVLTCRFGAESRVIFICRDKDLLLASGIKHIYQLAPLTSSEALRLFSICAFNRICPLIGYEKLSDRAICLANGIPLVIAAIGSELIDRSKLEWELLLSRYERLDKVIRIKEGSSAVSDVTYVAGKPMGYWKGVLSTYGQSSDEENLGSEISSFGISDDEDMSLTGNITTYNCVGMDNHIQKVCGELMELEYDNEIRIVGIWGVGGIGKTTLARLVYEDTMSHFHTHVFLENVGNSYQDHGSSSLVEELMWEYIKRSSKNVSNVTKERLRNRKVLLVVDGVDNNEQMENVKKVSTWFGAGSRVIVTTRDENLLEDNGVKHASEVKCLKVHEALQLFYQLAFKQQNPTIYSEKLMVRAVQLAGRVPLALEVLASLLRGKDDWESVLQEVDRQKLLTI